MIAPGYTYRSAASAVATNIDDHSSAASAATLRWKVGRGSILIISAPVFPSIREESGRIRFFAHER
jgi:hypothetical protein